MNRSSPLDRDAVHSILNSGTDAVKHSVESHSIHASVTRRQRGYYASCTFVCIGLSTLLPCDYDNLLSVCLLLLSINLVYTGLSTLLSCDCVLSLILCVYCCYSLFFYAVVMIEKLCLCYVYVYVQKIYIHNYC